jgi:hypothetical protein
LLPKLAVLPADVFEPPEVLELPQPTASIASAAHAAPIDNLFILSSVADLLQPAVAEQQESDAYTSAGKVRFADSTGFGRQL